MFTKSLIAAAAIAIVGAASTAPANAKVNVDLYLGGFDAGYGYGYYDPPAPRQHHPRPHYGDDYGYDNGISCEQGRREVRYAGFRKVRPIDCNGRRYTYEARRGYNDYVIKVSRRTGDIISVRESW
jgi:hypothetical protein